MKKPKIIYTGLFSFPSGGAAARRILGISQAFQLLDYEVLVASGQSKDVAPESDTYKDIKVISLGERTAEHMPRFLKHFLYMNIGSKTLKWLDSLNSKPEIIILYGAHIPYFYKILPWCKRNNVRLVFDAVEWYDPPNFLHWFVNPYYWNTELAIRYFSPKAKRIIAISKYLENFYRKHGCETVRIPPTLDVKNVKYRIESERKNVITLGYAGSPGHKDFFNNILEALFQIDIEGSRLKLKIAGITETQLVNYPAIRKRKLKTVPLCIETVGFVSQEEAINLIRSVDYSVLLRANKRYSKAGFPTKFVESLSVGTPIIANLTSNMEDYLENGKNGFICESHSVLSLKEKLLQVMKLSQNEYTDLRLQARSTAEKFFDFRHYTNALVKLIEN